jgi:hypothetical protein
MSQLIDKVVLIAKDLAASKGPFALFGLLQREEAQDRWDLVVSAAWLRDDSIESLREITHPLQTALEPADLMRISRVVLLNPSDAFVQTVNKFVSGFLGHLPGESPQDYVGIANCDAGDVHIKQGWVLTAQGVIAEEARGNGGARLSPVGR